MRNKENNTTQNKASLFKSWWRFFSSTRLALILILILVVLCLIGALVIQSPFNAMSDPEKYASWLLNAARPRFGSWIDILSFLQLFNVFHSILFFSVAALLMLNIVLCTVSRWSSVKRSIDGMDLHEAEGFYRRMADKNVLQLSGSASGVRQIINSILAKKNYRVRTIDSGNVSFLAADRNRFSPLGTLLTHLSLILFVLGFLIGGFWGFRDSSIIIAEGAKREIGHNTGLSLELKSFEDEYWDDGSPKDFRSQVALHDGEQEVSHALIRVNSPLNYRDISIYQSSFGPVAWIQVRIEDDLVRDGPIPFTQATNWMGVQRYAAGFDLPEAGLLIQLVSPAARGNDELLKEDELGIAIFNTHTKEDLAVDKLELGVPRAFGGLELTYVEKMQYSGFEVAKNPGIDMIWIASALFVLGLGMVFYFPVRQVLVSVETRENGINRIMISSKGRSGLSSQEMNDLVGEISKQQSGNKIGGKKSG